jgi:branched-chain amino acid transport system ATP-binding protein
MLKVENISTGYGKKQVLYDVSFEVNTGEVVILTGGNGSGKSTVLKSIYGLLPLWSGKTIFNGENISECRPFEMIKKGIVYIPQKRNFFEHLTVKENLEVSGSIYSKSSLSERISNVFEIIPLLKELIKGNPFNLSGGERQILVLGMAFIHQPEIILFDEPFSGVDSRNTEIIKTIINNGVSKNSCSYLIVEHRRDLYSFSKNHLQMSLGKIIKI